MNALTQAIKTVNEVTLKNAAITNAEGWSASLSVSEMFAAWEAHKKEQTVALTSPCGANIEVVGVFATGNMHSHCRISYKVNGKRAKAVDVEAMFRDAAPVVATVEMRKKLGALVGM